MEQNADQLLVTGGSGWLGRALLRTLLAEPDAIGKAGIRVLVLPGDAQLEEPDSAERMSGDLRNPADCARLCQEAAGATLLHTAGMIHPRRTREFYDVNLVGTVNLLEAAAAAGVRRAVVVSSNSPCGANPHPDHLFDESSPYRPYMSYGDSKMRMELAARRLHEQGELEVVILRAPWFYGPFQPPRQTAFFRMIRDGGFPLLAGGHCRRSMVYIDDLCQALRLAATSERAAGETYWIADERPYSMNEIVDTVEHLLETEFGQRCRHRRMRLPGIVGDLARVADWSLQALGLYQQKIHVLSEMNLSIACSIEKATRELGYAPSVGLVEGMRRSIADVLEREAL